jgi:hypothetical protein
MIAYRLVPHKWQAPDSTRSLHITGGWRLPDTTDAAGMASEQC